MANEKKAIFALAGYSGTGKSTLADLLVTARGFTAYEGSQLIREHARTAGIALRERADYEAHHHTMVGTLGATCLADIMLDSPDSRQVYVGLRTKPHFRRFKEAGGVVAALVCPPEVCVARGDHTDPKNATTLEAYRRNCETAENTTSENGSQVEWVIKHADIVIDTSRPQVDSESELLAFVDEHLLTR